MFGSVNDIAEILSLSVIVPTISSHFLFTKMDKKEIIAKLTKMRQHYIHIYNTYMLPLRLFS